MARLRARHLPHRIDITRLTGEGAEGPVWAAPDLSRPAYVEQKSKLVIDRRSTSATHGQEIIVTAWAVLLPEDDTAPSSKVLMFKGTPREREAEVVGSDLYDYNADTPNHVEIYLA